MTKAAIVIGVNRTGNLPLLRAAVSGANEFAAWLRGEGFAVYPFLDEDEQKPVRVDTITGKITELVQQATTEQLVIYFSGHGFLHNFSEFWMLSGAPGNANEAICLTENIALARECGVPSVVIISDACRSTPQSLQAERVRGSLIFPNESVSRSVRPEVDRYFAALPGNPALEMTLDESVKQHEGVFTHCFLKAYQQPDAEMVRQVKTDGRTIYVVPNRRLKEYLRREVSALLHRKNLQVGQLPDAIVESGESVYIGRAVVPPVAVMTGYTAAKITPVPYRDIDVQDIARIAVASTIGVSLDLPNAPAAATFPPDRTPGITVSNMIAAATAQSAFDASVRLVSRAQEQGARRFETGTGFKLVGAGVSEVLGLDVPAELLSGGDGDEPAYIRLHPGSAGRVSSVIVRFTDGSGTVLAGIESYIGTVTVENGRVMNVSYVPAADSYRWGDYRGERTRLEKLRATVAAAARFGVFRVEREDASRIAGQIRYLKSVDPTLGLYAAYAYAEVGLRSEVQDVLNYMRGDLSPCYLMWQCWQAS